MREPDPSEPQTRTAPLSSRDAREHALTHSQPGPGSRPNDARDLRVAVVGAGLMGHSIAGVFASAGTSVVIYDPDATALSVVHERVHSQLAGLKRDPCAVERIELGSDLQASTVGADLVVEAIPERLALKQQLFESLGRWLPNAVLATNTSSLRLADIVKRTEHPDRVIATHWFNPPHLVPLVEVVPGDATTPANVAWMIDILRQIGKLPVYVRKDIPGFIANRIQHAMWREAISLVEKGVCDADTVDLVVRNSFGLRLSAMGPLENADFVGLDLTLAVHEAIFPSLASDREPSQLLRDMVAAGTLGAKTGAGFTTWSPERYEEAAERLEQHLINQLKADLGVRGR